MQYNRHSRLAASVLACALVQLALAGCGDDAMPPGSCRVDPDCPDEQRCADGVCTPVIGGDVGPGRESGADDGGPGETAPVADALADLGVVDQQGVDGASCQANSDQVIQRAEMPVVVGGEVAYTIGSGLTVNLAGSEQGGTKVWSLEADAADDARTTAKLLPLFDWAKDDYPDATYVSLIDQGYGTYGVFKVSDSALQLLGVISKDEPTLFAGTNLPYYDPIDMLRFPLGGSTAFETSSSATGTFDGIGLHVTESYDVKALGAGKLKLPQLTLDVVAVQVNITQTPYLNPLLTDYRTVFLFVAECYGIVGRVVVDDKVDDLTQVAAKERWRLAF